MADDLFDQLEAEVEVPTVDVDNVTFEDLVGEGKRYRDQDAVAKALAHKDAFIEQLKRENAEARQAASERISMEQFLQRLEAGQTDTSPSDPGTIPGERDGKEPLTPADVERMLEAREEKRRRDANLADVQKRLKETLGPSWQQTVREKAEQLGTNTKWLTDVAARSPQAFYQLVGIAERKPTDTFSPPPRGSVTSAPPMSNAKNYEYWNDQRKTKGEAWYFSIPVQQERWKALQELGEEAFYKRK